ncbi:MAG: hypothetical protein M3442_00790 [Chloroflexota bacterium]|nr:hypothetical protein [Chloroflexota bacterium]
MGIPWPVERPLLSARDGRWSRLAEAVGLPPFNG